MTIMNVTAFPLSFPIPKEFRVKLGIGTAIKRDCVLVKIVTSEGIVGWGEAHAGRAPGAVAQLVNTTIRTLVVGMNAFDAVGVWDRIYKRQLASHGMGAASAIAMSGVDMALWDIRGKAAGWPLHKLLGGGTRAIRAYAGGVSLGYQPADELVSEAERVVSAGYKALKLRLGDTPKNDIERVGAVRDGLGPEIDILTDANAAYSMSDVRTVMPALDEANVGWLEEPFPPHDHRLYAMARHCGRTPLAAGENHYTRFEFQRVIEDAVISIIQPDLSKTGGITEGLRIANMASGWKVSFNPHTSLTGLNMAASLHVLASVDNGGYFEADLARYNPFRDELCSWQPRVNPDGEINPPDDPGLGVEIDEELFQKFPLIDGPGYV